MKGEYTMDFLTVKPRYLIRDMQDEMSKMIESVFEDFGITENRKNKSEGYWMPAVEFSENDNNFELKAELPGMTKDDIEVEISNSNIVIKGETKQEKEEKTENIYRSEFRYGKFLRTIPLPAEIKSDEAKAAFKDGILKITAPKAHTEMMKLNKLSIE